MADARVIDEGAGAPDAVGGTLAATEFAQAIRLGAQAAQEHPALAFGHREPPSPSAPRKV